MARHRGTTPKSRRHRGELAAWIAQVRAPPRVRGNPCCARGRARSGGPRTRSCDRTAAAAMALGNSVGIGHTCAVADEELLKFLVIDHDDPLIAISKPAYINLRLSRRQPRRHQVAHCPAHTGI